jgi:hypothetical protein
LPYQARAGANLQAGDLSRDARWRFQRHNGEWWYFSPENTWLYHRDGRWNQFSQDAFQPNPAFSGQYRSAYRGMQGEGPYGGQYADGSYQSQGPAQRLYRDRYGREYVCENGRRVYVSSQRFQGQEYGTGYRGRQDEQFPGEQGQMTPTPAIPNDPNASGVQGTTQQGQFQAQQGPAAVPGDAELQGGTATAPGTAGAVDAGANTGGVLPAEAPRSVLQDAGEITPGNVEAAGEAR